MSQPTTTDYLRQATHFINYAAFLHLKHWHYRSALTSMAPSKSKDRVHWTDEDISALVVSSDVLGRACQWAWA